VIELDIEPNSDLRHDLVFDRRLDDATLLGRQQYLLNCRLQYSVRQGSFEDDYLPPRAGLRAVAAKQPPRHRGMDELICSLVGNGVRGQRFHTRRRLT